MYVFWRNKKRSYSDVYDCDTHLLHHYIELCRYIQVGCLFAAHLVDAASSLSRGATVTPGDVMDALDHVNGGDMLTKDGLVM